MAENGNDLDEIASETPDDNGDGSFDPSHHTVLVVDDDKAVLRVAAKTLRRGGYHVLEAHGPQEAEKIYGEHRDEIDLLLSDVVMPDMNGRELVERLRAQNPDLRYVFMSAYTEDDQILTGVREHKVPFINKPFTVGGLREKVQEVLEARPLQEDKYV